MFLKSLWTRGRKNTFAFSEEKMLPWGFFLFWGWGGGLKLFMFFCSRFSPYNRRLFSSRSKSASDFIRSFLFSGTCCSYRPHVTAIDDRGNTRATTLDFSGGVFFNTTVDNFDHLVKSSEMVRKKDFLSFVAFTVCCFCEIGDLEVEKWNICWLI